MLQLCNTKFKGTFKAERYVAEFARHAIFPQPLLKPRAEFRCALGALRVADIAQRVRSTVGCRRWLARTWLSRAVRVQVTLATT
jgi:hypothetical protein